MIQAENDKLIAHEYKKALFLKSRRPLTISDSESEDGNETSLKRKRETTDTNYEMETTNRSARTDEDSEHESSVDDVDFVSKKKRMDKVVGSEEQFVATITPPKKTYSRNSRVEKRGNISFCTPKSRVSRSAGSFISKQQVDSVKTNLFGKLRPTDNPKDDERSFLSDSSAFQLSQTRTARVNLSSEAYTSISSNQFQWEDSAFSFEQSLKQPSRNNTSTPISGNSIEEQFLTNNKSPPKRKKQHYDNLEANGSTSKRVRLNESPHASSNQSFFNGSEKMANSNSSVSQRTPRSVTSSVFSKNQISPDQDQLSITLPSPKSPSGENTSRSQRSLEYPISPGGESNLSNQRTSESPKSVNEQRNLRNRSSFSNSSRRSQRRSQINSTSRNGRSGRNARNSREPLQESPSNDENVQDTSRQSESADRRSPNNENRRLREIDRNARNRHALRMRSINDDDDGEESPVTSEDGE